MIFRIKLSLAHPEDIFYNTQYRLHVCRPEMGDKIAALMNSCHLVVCVLAGP